MSFTLKPSPSTPGGHGPSRVLGFRVEYTPGRGTPVLPAAQRGASCPVDHTCRGRLLLHSSLRA
eukprot:41784-Prorocentrum_minimum.AAC.1